MLNEITLFLPTGMLSIAGILFCLAFLSSMGKLSSIVGILFGLMLLVPTDKLNITLFVLFSLPGILFGALLLSLSITIFYALIVSISITNVSTLSCNVSFLASSKSTPSSSSWLCNLFNCVEGWTLLVIDTVCIHCSSRHVAMIRDSCQCLCPYPSSSTVPILSPAINIAYKST